MTSLSLDYETASEIQLSTRHKAGRGLDVYSADESTRVLMCAYSWGNDAPKLWTRDDGSFPAELKDALLDPHVKKKAFNAQFERVITKRVLGIDTPYENWRCTMVLGLMQSFVGDLAAMGQQVGLPLDQQKLSEGKRLINLFCQPQRTSAKKPLRWRDAWTDPEDWELFCEYCLQDVVAEQGIERRLRKFPIPEEEWRLYEIDQIINDRGLPIDLEFCRNAAAMAARRKAELVEELTELTGLSNPNSPTQLLGWVRDRGYPFADLQKDTVKKVLADNATAAGATLEVIDAALDDEDPAVISEVTSDGFLEPEAIMALNLRQQSARTSVKKYDKIMLLVGKDGRLRFGFQFGGASRTLRWAGRGLNPQNLARLAKELEVSKAAHALGVPMDYLMTLVTDLVRANDYEGLCLVIKEPLNALATTVRSAIRADDDEELMACDLSSIETCVIAWLAGCIRLINVFRNKQDPYIDFATDLYEKAYEEVTKPERQNAKPAVLGAGFRLGGGELRDGKKTGLWAYAESLGVPLTQEESHKAVKLYRENYPEIPKLWYALEKAIEKAMHERRPVAPLIKIGSRQFTVPVVIEMMDPYLTIKLPSGRRLYYYKPQMKDKIMRGKPTEEYPEGEPYKKRNFTYMGKQQNGNAWIRVWSHGGKVTENIVQAIARDILAVGMRRAFDAGFPIIGHVHDELINLIRKGSKRFTGDALKVLMTADIDWAEGLPLGAAYWVGPFYRKD